MAKKEQTPEEQVQEAEFRSGGHMFATIPYENADEAQPVEASDEDSEE